VPKFFADVASIECADEKLWLLKPVTFMNLSGQSVSAFVRYYNIALQEMLVAYDEIDLPPGVARLKMAGGHGGHNGMRDIFSHLGKDFWRLRIGVGHPGHKDQVVNYVLGIPSCTDRQLIESSQQRVLDILPDIAVGKMSAAMNALHSREE
jgi:PTH1 family peptidyl-tRNA hydrolase